MLIRRTRPLNVFGRDREAIAAVEFCLILPVFLILLFMGVDLGRYVQATAQVARIESSVAQLLTARSAAVNQPVTVQDNDVLFIMQSSFITYPYLLEESVARGVPIWNEINLVISSISFMPGPSGCSGLTCTTYTPKVIWSSPLGSTPARSCSVPPTSVPSSMAPSATTLPADVFPPSGTGTAGTPMGNIVVVDVAYQYRSIWGLTSVLALKPPLIKRSAYVAPRYTIASQNGITYSGPSFFTTICS